MTTAMQAKLDLLTNRMNSVRQQVSLVTNSSSWMDQAAHAKRALLEIEGAMEATLKVLEEVASERT